MIGKIGTGTVFPLTCIVKRQGIANSMARNALSLFSRLCRACAVAGFLCDGWPWAGFLVVLGEEDDKVSLFALMCNSAALKGPAHDDR